jgi:hypothetical protein
MRTLSRRALRLRAARHIPPRKENAPCCVATRDDLGRYCVGFCGPTCVRRPQVWARLNG